LTRAGLLAVRLAKLFPGTRKANPFADADADGLPATGQRVTVMTPRHDLIVVGGSAGAIGPLSTLLAALPPDLSAPLVVVLHRPSTGSGGLQAVLGRACALPVKAVEDGERLAPGMVYVAPPDLHVLVHRDHLLLARSAKVNRVRPAVDPLFRSAARWYGPRTIGIVFSGALDDGSVGLATIQAVGGTGLVEDPGGALFPGMPFAALAAAPGAKALPVTDLAAAVVEVLDRPVPAYAPDPEAELVAETDLTELDQSSPVADQPGTPAPVACPECRGGMNRVNTGTAVHYRCHVGHAYSPQTLLAAQTESAESALWTAVSILEEQVGVHRELMERAAGADQRRHRQAMARRLAAAESVRRAILGSLEVADE
jgi:two-component system chemotaxis response regulator CheB